MKTLITIFVLLLPLVSMAQECTINVYPDSQTIKAGETVTIVAADMNFQPGKQFVVDYGGRATLHAARRIEFNNGFKALSGSNVFAGIVPCDPDGGDAEPSVVFPNPTDGIINIKTSYKISALRLTDMSGFPQPVKTDINDMAASMDLSQLKRGYYILEIIAGRSVVESVRIEKK